MDHKKIIQVPATTREIVEKTTCDLCGRNVDPPKTETNDDVTISHRRGESWPSGGYGTTETIDMCGDCFQSKLKPWLAAQGAIVRRSDWDY